MNQYEEMKSEIANEDYHVSRAFKADFLAAIAEAKDGAELRGLRVAFQTSHNVLISEHQELEAAINRRFGQLNGEAVGPQKGRWS